MLNTPRATHPPKHEGDDEFLVGEQIDYGVFSANEVTVVYTTQIV
jgi:hypothetical protein